MKYPHFRRFSFEKDRDFFPPQASPSASWPRTEWPGQSASGAPSFRGVPLLTTLFRGELVHDIMINGFAMIYIYILIMIPYGFRIWVCLKIGYIPNYSHLIGIMIIKHWV